MSAGAARRGVIDASGAAAVNGIPVAPGMAVGVGDELVTEAGASLTVVVGRDALLLRSASRVQLTPAARGAAYVLRVLAGAVLAVFEPGVPKQIRTATAVVGIRGTAGYFDVQPDRTYVCICYGTAELAAVDDPAAAETVRTRHHDEPRYIYRRGMPRMMEVAPVVNHTDDELRSLEALVGRQPPFVGKY